MANDKLKAHQEAGQKVEKDMLAFLLQFLPALILTVGDVKQIARHASRLAFDHYSDAELQ